MSEEEKDIEYLKRYIEWDTYGERSLERAIETILNLYTNQDIQIKELKSLLNKIKEIYFTSKDLEELDNSLGDIFNVNIDTINLIPKGRFIK